MDCFGRAHWPLIELSGLFCSCADLVWCMQTLPDYLQKYVGRRQLAMEELQGGKDLYEEYLCAAVEIAKKAGEVHVHVYIFY